jgi:hypothetical protein
MSLENTINNLRGLNVQDKTEKKNNMTYLSWSYAWDEVLKIYPKATYEILKQENGLPYVYDKETGYMVFTKVTIENLTHEMWLPVMDGSNKSMKSEAYSYKTRNGDKYVAAATMFDINKTIMRCLVKNLAMFGLGLYIYAGEDLPDNRVLTDERFSKAIEQIKEGKLEKSKLNFYILTEEQENELNNL